MANRVPKDMPDPVDKYVGSRVRARRIGLRMSQTNLGKAVGVTFQQIQKYENGTNRIGASNLYKIAQSMEVDVGYFFAGLDGTKGSRPSAAATEAAAAVVGDPMMSDEALKMMYNYFRIKNDHVRHRLFQFIKSMADSEDPE
jgi:transcriptional regulator with XRE-family HTH domain